MRLTGRFIPRDSILKAVDAIVIFEVYQDDKYLPAISSLVDWVPIHFMWSLQWMWLVIIFVSSRHIGQKLASGLMT
jgi:hypothetical protein